MRIHRWLPMAILGACSANGPTGVETPGAGAICPGIQGLRCARGQFCELPADMRFGCLPPSA